MQNGPTEFKLIDGECNRESIVEIEAKYIPVDIQLEPRESLTSEDRYTFFSQHLSNDRISNPDQGVLRVELMSGKGLHAADRGGGCDQSIRVVSTDKSHQASLIPTSSSPSMERKFSNLKPKKRH